jgi:dTMP kinase
VTHGIFITLEGGEGAGKTTQQSLLAKALRTKGLEVLTTREPGGSPGAEDIRRLLVEGEVERWTPMSETLLLLAARNDHLARTILPALEKGTCVVCDRFSDSTVAYQGGGLELGADMVRELSGPVVGEMAPDLTLILDIEVEAGCNGRRLASMERQETIFRDTNAWIRSFTNACGSVFSILPRKNQEGALSLIAAQEMDKVHGDIMAALNEKLGAQLP